MPATIKDVARAVGMSVATVSRALNGFENVLPETRERVLEAARKLHYSPSGAARSMVLRRTDTIGALLPDLHGEFFSELIRGIDAAARSRGLHLLLSSSHGNADETAAAIRAMNGRVDGLLVMSPHVDADFLAQNVPPSLPAVLMNAGVSASRHPVFAIDNYGGALAMTRHLLASGHRRIAFLGGPDENFEARERQRGYVDGLGAAQPAQLLPGDFTEACAAATATRLAAMPAAERPDAIFAANDAMAVALLAGFTAAGLRVPQDIAIAGFDDIPLARYVNPALTTMRVPIAQLGSQALDALTRQIEAGADAAPQPEVLMPVELVVRQSCGAR